MARRDESPVAVIMTMLSELPWWISICVGAVVFAVCRFVIPAIMLQSPILKGMAPLPKTLAWGAVIFLLPAAMSLIQSKRKSKLLDRQSGIDSIRSLSWKEFEELLAEAYRRQGYTVEENEPAGPDGGIDLTIQRDGNLYLVQCKQWRAFKVGVNVAREMFGLMTAEGANGAIIVTSGMFTQEAKNFAAGKPLDLVEGNQLVDLVRNVQSSPEAPADERGEPPGIKCPECGGELVLRQAKRGSNAGSKFWGCLASRPAGTGANTEDEGLPSP